MTWTGILNKCLGIVKSLFTFQDPRLAWMAFGAALFGILLAVDNTPAIQKLGFTLPMGLGVGYLAISAKAFLGGRYSNLGLLMGWSGLALVYLAVKYTPDYVFAQSTLDDYGIVLVAAIIGLFSKVEDG